MAGDFVFVLLILYCQQGISKSFCLKIGWSPESKTEARLTYLSFSLESAALFFQMDRIAHTVMGAAEQTLHQTHSVYFNSFRM